MNFNTKAVRKKLKNAYIIFIMVIVFGAITLLCNNMNDFHRVEVSTPPKIEYIDGRLHVVDKSSNTNYTDYYWLLPVKNESSNTKSHFLQRPIVETTNIMKGENEITTYITNDVFGDSKAMDTERKRYLALLNDKGYESVDEHEFKSPYIVDPPFYQISDDYTVPKAPGNRNMKVISLLNVLSKYKRVSDFDMSKCPYSECTIDIHGTKAKEADVLLFVCVGLKPLPSFPRRPEQLWGLTCHESPVYWNYQGTDPKLFNFTAGYFQNTDVWFPFVELNWKAKLTLKSHDEYVSMAKNKTKTAAWIAGNCRSDRFNFVMEMKKYMDIDIFGRCGTMKCEHGDEHHCLRDYKFYLSFENSFCEDYITEKFNWRFYYKNNPIPVVKGGGDYDKYFPSNSFINGEHYTTAKDLAVYLTDLAKDNSRYAKFLEEKDKLKASSAIPKFKWCSFCEALHTNKFSKTTNIYDIKQKPCQNSTYRIV